jgi:hypothetical protein
MDHSNKVKRQRMNNARIDVESRLGSILDHQIRPMKVLEEKGNQLSLLEKEFDRLSHIYSDSITKNRDNIASVNVAQVGEHYSNYMVKLSSFLEDSNQRDTKNFPINHDLSFDNISEGAALGLFEFPFQIKALQNNLDVYSSLKIDIQPHHLNLTGEQWLKRARANKSFIYIVGRLLSISDACYRKNIDSVKIMAAVSQGVFSDNPELESAWCKVAANAYSGADFDEWRYKRSITILSSFVNGDISGKNFSIKDGAFTSLLADVPLFRFDAVHGLNMGDSDCLVGAYSNNANGIAQIMNIPINDSGIVDGQTSDISNTPNAILSIYNSLSDEMKP